MHSNLRLRDWPILQKNNKNQTMTYVIIGVKMNSQTIIIERR